MYEKVRLYPELDKETRDKLRLDLKLYGFDLTLEELEELLAKEKSTLSYSTRESIPYGRETVQLLSCKRIITNKRGTLHLAIWSNGRFSIFNKDARPSDLPRIVISYSCKGNTIWDDLKEGMYVAFSESYWDKELTLGTLTDCTTREEAEDWLSLYGDCLRKVFENDSFEEIRPVYSIEKTGFTSRQTLKDWESRIDSVIKKIQELELQEVANKDNALKTRISLSGSTVAINAVDDHIYTIETQRLWTREEWVDFVYRHRYRWTQHEQEYVKERTLFNEVVDKLVASNLEWFKLSVDGKPAVKITIKHVTNKKNQDVANYYLNDRRVAYSEIRQALYQYFILGQALNPREVDEAERQRVLEPRKNREEAIINSGITGYLSDLEGEIPITIGFEKAGASWYLVVGEKRLLFKGGVETIRSLERVLKGTAQDYHARHSTSELYERLAKVLSPEEALEVISTAKEMGKLLKALDNKNQ